MSEEGEEFPADLSSRHRRYGFHCALSLSLVALAHQALEVGQGHLWVAANDGVEDGALRASSALLGQLEDLLE